MDKVLEGRAPHHLPGGLSEVPCARGIVLASKHVLFPEILKKNVRKKKIKKENYLLLKIVPRRQ